MAEPAPGATRSRTLMVTYLGAVVRPLGDWFPIGGTVELLTQVGLDAQSVRTAVFRLKRRGWLTSESRASTRGYSLSEAAQEALAAGDRVIWHGRGAADLADGWCLVNVSVPESARSERHQLRAHLTSLGFGNLGSGVWIAPARLRPAAEHAIGELGLSARCALFLGEFAAGPSLPELVAQAWDLEQIDRRYRDFLADVEPTRTGKKAYGAQAFVTYLQLLDRWRRLPFHDPGLPVQVLPAGWPEPSARALFETLVARYQEPALAHARTQWPDRA